MTDVTNPVAELCRRWRTTIPQVAVCRAVADAFPDLSSLPLPINLHELAGRRRITNITEVPLDCDGLLCETESGALAVQLNEDHPLTRKRFTLAHEIGHTLFLEWGTCSHGEAVKNQDMRIGRNRRGWNLEFLCHQAAVEIIMPFDRLAGMVRGWEMGAECVTRLVRIFGVSLEAAARRLVQVSPIKIVAVMWGEAVDGSGLYALWATGRAVASIDHLQIKPTDKAFETFNDTKRFREKTWMSLGGALDKYLVDGVEMQTGKHRRVLTVFILGMMPGQHSVRESPGKASLKTRKDQLRLL